MSLVSAPVSTPHTALVIGSGGREHALALALSQDPAVTEVHAAPGNPGMEAVASVTTSTRSTASRWRRWPSGSASTWSSSGPEAPLVAGVADAVRARGIAGVRPDAAAAAGSRDRRRSPRR